MEWMEPKDMLEAFGCSIYRHWITAMHVFFFKILNRITKYETLLEGNFTPERGGGEINNWVHNKLIY
jgi:hypothetical protein